MPDQENNRADQFWRIAVLGVLISVIGWLGTTVIGSIRRLDNGAAALRVELENARTRLRALERIHKPTHKGRSR